MATRKGTNARSTAAKLTGPTRVTRAAAARAPSSALSLEPSLKPTKASLSATEKAKSRKPLVNRNGTQPSANMNNSEMSRKEESEDGDREPIKAFLRIRPQLGDSDQTSAPYLKELSSSKVQMTDPSGSNRIRLSPQSQVYTFNHVFPPETPQARFFNSTALPLVSDLLSGQNGLIFAYGVTNSGKTYTIQGGKQADTAGLLPRTLDVIFNSLDGLQSKAPYRPVRLAGVEHALQDNDPQFSLPNLPDDDIIDVLDESDIQDIDKTTVKIDKNYEYSIWISYAEVYNEKVYDLLSDGSSEMEGNALGTPQGSSGLPKSSTAKHLPRFTSTWQSLATLTSSRSDVLLLKRKALTLKNDPEAGGKFVAGLKCVCIRSAEEAKRIFRMGNINRRVFGTLANAVSSRSHGIFTIRAIRIHKADHSDVTVSRLSVVDLAGSERTKNTHNTGDRLKEAGNINKSLMVLGQCMEALRNNQRRLAASLAAPGRGALGPRSDTSNMKLAIVPFRHSKLTELFQDFFVGEHDGRAVMIVNVNPYDTGFDENSHVMRFAALAREVTTTPAAVPTRAKVKKVPPPATLEVQAKSATSQCRKVTLSTGGTKGRKASEAHLEVVEEDEESDEDNNEPTDPLVEALFEEIEELRIKLYESEMRCAVIEAEIREEIMEEMETRMMNMERTYAKRLMHAVEQSEAKTDAKIDMLHHFGAFSSKPHSTGILDAEATASVKSEYSNTSMDSEDAFSELQGGDNVSDASTEELNISPRKAPSSPSPLQRKSKTSKGVKTTLDSGPEPECIGLRDEEMGIDELDADETMTIGEDDDDDEVSEENEEPESQEDYSDEDNWEPSHGSSPDTSIPVARPSKVLHAYKGKTANTANEKRTIRGVSGLQKRMDVLTLSDDDWSDKLPASASTDGGSRNDSKTAKGKARQTGSTSTRRSTRRIKA